MHGGFSSWSPWVECSASCGGGVTTRSRLCDNPSPRYGGNDCSAGKQGSSVESKTCNSFQCEGADLFTQWSEWTTCNKKCGGGVSFRKRTCTSPLPNGNGQDCSLRGSLTQTKACNMEPCSGKMCSNFKGTILVLQKGSFFNGTILRRSFFFSQWRIHTMDWVVHVFPELWSWYHFPA